MNGLIRLDRCLAMLGLGSRSEVKQLIRKGQVAIEGVTVTDPNLKLDAEHSRITVSGKEMVFKAERTVMLYKPAGVLTAARDKSQPTVMDLVPPMYRAMDCMPAGRLDKDTTGLLILTSNGDLAHRLISPEWEVGKTYEARIDGSFTEADKEAFGRGLLIKDTDGTFEARPAQARVLEDGENSLVEVRVTEGKYHQVKRMFAMRGYQVLTLKRVKIGRLRLDPALEPGNYRELTPEEIALLSEEDEE